MRYIKISIKMLLVFLLATSCMQTREFQNNNYQKVDGEWYLIQSDGETKLPIVKNTLTLKYQKDATEEQVKEFELEHSLKLLRKAKTGWHDYEIPTESNIFDMATAIEKSSIINALEIPTGGSYE